MKALNLDYKCPMLQYFNYIHSQITYNELEPPEFLRNFCIQPYGPIT